MGGRRGLERRTLAASSARASRRGRPSQSRCGSAPLAPPAIDRAARLGDGWLAGPGITPDQARRQIDQYRERRAAHGLDRGLAAIRRDVYVGASAEEARATAEPIVRAGYRGFAPEALVVGSAEQVAESFAALAAMGYSDVIMRNLIADPAKAVASTERLGQVRELVAKL